MHWIPLFDFSLWDKDSNKEIMDLDVSYDEDDAIKGVILGLQAIKEPPVKIM